MTARQSKNNAFLLALVWLGFAAPSRSLFCTRRCSISQVPSSPPLINMFNRAFCRSDTSSSICKARIVAFYDTESYPRYINYTLGTTNEQDAHEYERYFADHGLTNFTKHQLIVDVKTKETRIIADFYCNAADDCAAYSIEQLSEKYRRQTNPLFRLQPLIHAEQHVDELLCYDAATESTQTCRSNLNQTVSCLSNSKELQQECTAGPEIGVHVEFMLSSPYYVEFDRTDELVKCNVDECNHLTRLATIKDISREYAYGMASISSHARTDRRGTLFNVLSMCFLAFALWS